MSAAAGQHAADDDTRRKVVAAAVDCILDCGFYRASSNEIARRAGTTWGAIQYYFGTREKLMLAALQMAEDRMAEALDPDALTAGSTEGRLQQLARMLAEQYGRREYLAGLQIVLNLAHSPDTSRETARALVQSHDRLSAQVRRLIRTAVGADVDSATSALVFNACRGVALSHLITTETTPGGVPGRRERPSMQDAERGIARALALYLADRGNGETTGAPRRG